MAAAIRKHWLVSLIVVAGFAADQISKALIIRYVPFRTSWPGEGFFRFTHVGNRGSAFGLIDDANLVLMVVSFVGVGILLYFYRAQQDPTLAVRASLGLMLAGALGNLVDRVANGHVTDFIDVGPWWIFNLADASIVTGITLLASSLVLGSSKSDEAVDDASAEPVPEFTPVLESTREEPDDEQRD